MKSFAEYMMDQLDIQLPTGELKIEIAENSELIATSGTKLLDISERSHRFSVLCK